jgi:outer membrane lipoprotein-sorting protein
MTCSRACARFSLAFLLASGTAEAVDADAGAPKQQTAASDAGTKPAPGQENVDVASLLSAFSKMPGLEASFSEEKHIALLAKPLTSRGTLFFTHPGLLLRRIEAPEPSEVVISKDSLRMRDKAGEQTLDLRTRKDIRPFVESLTWILAGDRAALEKVYTIAFQPEQAARPWQLSLKPKVLPLSQLIAELRIQGRGMYVAQIEVQETSGDKTITRILSANPKRTFSAAERAKLFGEAPAKGARPAP